MSRPIEFRRLRVEDFDEKDQPVVSQIAFAYNNFGQQVVESLNGNIDFNNLARELKTVQIQVDSTGKPLIPAEFVLSKINQVAGITVVAAFNLTNPTTYPNGAPFVSFSQTGTKVIITNVTGLRENDVYSINIEVF